MGNLKKGGRAVTSNSLTPSPLGKVPKGGVSYRWLGEGSGKLKSLIGKNRAAL